MVSVTGEPSAKAAAVALEAVADSTSGWAFGFVEVTRTDDDVSQPLTVTVEAAKANGQGGYAPPVSTEVAFAAGQKTAQVVVIPTQGLPAGTEETVRVSVRDGTSSVEVMVRADPEVVETFPIGTNPVGAVGAMERLKTAVQSLGALKGKLTPAQWEMVLDLTGLTLDLVGIFEPTPIADTLSVALSVYRRDFLGAGLSGLGVIPYLGDIAKLEAVS